MAGSEQDSRRKRKDIERLLLSQPGVKQVAVVQKEEFVRNRPYHLNDLFVVHKEPEAAKRVHASALEKEYLQAMTEQNLAIQVGEPLQIDADDPQTLADVLKRASKLAENIGIHYVLSDGEEVFQSYANLLCEAKRLLAGLRQKGLRPGDAVLFQFDRNQNFITAFWACVLGGFLPTPIATAPTYAENNAVVSKLKHAFELLGKPLVLTDLALLKEIEGLGRLWETEELFVAAVEQLLQAEAEEQAEEQDSQPSDFALNLLTSGSTGKPKCVQHRHQSLLARTFSAAQFHQFGDEEVVLNWMPLDHVGGLIMSHLMGIYLGCPQILPKIDPFLADPLRWLDWIEQYKATISWAPNFAFALVNDQEKRIEKGSWDLSSMRTLINGGEVVVAKTAHRFLKLLEPHGLPENAMVPAFGMSEIGSAVIFSDRFHGEDRHSGVQLLDKNSLNGAIQVADLDHPNVGIYTEMGLPSPGVSIRIVDEHGRVLPEGRIGRLQVQGPTVMAGYYNNPQANAEAFTEDGWFDSGDLGFLIQGRLTLTGRDKDVIILNGQNYFNYEIEAYVEELPGVEVTFAAACAVPDPKTGTDALAVFFSPIDGAFDEEGLMSLIDEIRLNVVQNLGIQPNFILPLSKAEFPKTNSGKIQRIELSKWFQAGHFMEILQQIDLYNENENTLPDWTYQTVWKRVDAKQQNSGDAVRHGRCLFFADTLGLADQIVAEKAFLEQSVRVEAGEAFAKIADNVYRINPQRAEDYLQLWQALTDEQMEIDHVVHLFSYSEQTTVSSLADLKESQSKGGHSLLFLLQALPTHPQRDLQLTVITTDALWVFDSERVAFEKAPLLGFLKTIPFEFPHIRCQLIDLSTTDSRSDHAVCVQKEWQATVSELEPVVAYRKGSRLVPRLQKADLIQGRTQNPPFVQKGLYLITGGLGGVGSYLAAHLLEQYQAKVVLVGRTPLPEQKENQSDKAQERLEQYLQLKQLEVHGGQVMYRVADLQDTDAIAALLEESEQQLGTDLDGVIHLAGLYDVTPLEELTPERLEELYAAKVYGTFALHQVVATRPNLLFLSASSVTTLLPGLGMGAYAAANCFAEQFALHQRRASQVMSTCLAFSLWEDVGMGRQLAIKEVAQSRGFVPISLEKGLYSLLAGIQCDCPLQYVGLDETKAPIQALTGTSPKRQPLLDVYYTADQKLSKSEWHRFVSSLDQDFSEGNAVKWRFTQLSELPLLENGEVDREALALLSDTRSAQNDRVAPRNETEQVLASIWKELLKTNRFGVTDNFFAVGGQSLKATQMLSAVRAKFGVEIPMRLFFQNPTIEGVTEWIAQIGTELETSDLPIEKKERGSVLPMSYAQKRQWFLYQMAPGNPYYNNTLSLHLQGPLRQEALLNGLQSIVNRHEVLRTKYDIVNEEPVQKIEPAFALVVSKIDLSGKDIAEREAEAQRVMRAEANKPFDLSQDPVLRATLIRMAEDEHSLLVSVHHIAFDGWSADVMIRELSVAYPLLAQGKALPFPKLPLQYADYSLWQKEWLSGSTLQQQLAYWKGQFAGEIPTLELPTDFRRPAMPTYIGKTLQVQVGPELLNSLQSLSQSAGATLFMTLLSAFSVLLHRYSRQEEMVIGTVMANRNRAEWENLIGFFANTLALRVNAAKNLTFTEHLERVKAMTLEAHEHQDVPFEMLVEELNVPRDLSRHPLFQTVFVLQNAQQEYERLGDLDLSYRVLGNDTSKFDLFMQVFEEGGGLRVCLEYSSDLFHEQTMQRFLHHYERLLQEIVTDPVQSIADYSFLTEAEQQQFAAWNETETLYPREACIHQLFEEHAAATPDAIAVVMDEQMMTYQEVNRRANQLAHYLKSIGVGAESRVALCVERSFEMIIGLLGILKAGGAYVPIDSTYPKERIAFMLEDTQVLILLTKEALATGLSQGGVQQVLLDSDWDRIAQECEDNPVCAVTAENLAYLIYTSGSTGKPKGVCIPHRGCVRLVKETNYMTFSPDQVFLQASTIAFDTAMFEIWGSLLNGARLVMLPPQMPSLDEFGQLIQRHQVTTMWLTSGFFNLIVDHQVAALSGVKYLLVGGDVVSVPHAKKVLEQGGTQLINGYGPTENSTFTTCHTITLADCERASLPIGKPVANTKVYVLDSGMKPVPLGVPGELYIGGDGVASGYLNRPELTAERFVDNPFSDRPNDKLYKTGDLVRFLPNGDLEFIGRLDNQVKIRGFRIEIGEIEAVLAQHRAVQEVVVLAREEVAGDRRLVAYVTEKAESTCEIEELRRYLKEKLPEYMVPSAFILLDSLPLTTNGKIDRRALPAPDPKQWMSEQAYTAPRNQTEELVANIFAQVLHLEQVGVYDNFFELGGHSLLATLVVTRLREAFAADLSLRVLFEHPNVAALTGLLTTLRQSDAKQNPVPMVQVERKGQALPLSYAQQRLWFLDRLLPDSGLYNIPVFLRLQGELNVDALRLSLHEIVERHESIRTKFTDLEGQAVQVIAPTMHIPLQILDFTALQEADREAELSLFADKEAWRPFDLQAGPLLRVCLVQMKQQESVLMLNMHHIISDGWSMGVLLQELMTFYQGYVKGERAALPPLPIQYADYAIWQREWLRGERFDQQMAYWKQQLGRSEPLLQLPTDRPRPAVQTYLGAHHVIQIPQELTVRLRERSRAESATLFMTLLAAFQTLLYRYSGQEDILVGSPIAGRHQQEIEGLIGFFVNTLVLRSHVKGDLPFTELLAQVRDVALRAYEHQDLPLEKIIDELGLERSLSYTPLFQVMFVMQNAPIQMQPVAELAIEPFFPPTHVMAKFDLTLSIEETDDSLQATFEYNGSLFDRETVVRLSDHFVTLLEGIAEQPTQSIAELPLLSEPEQQQWFAWSMTEEPVDQQQCVSRWFEEQVRKTPDQIAVQMGETALTYEELNGRANQLARYLQKNGVSTETLVAICAERSPEMIVGILGVWKAGGGYVPLDPSYPQERLAYMLENSGANVLLTQERVLEQLPFSPALTVLLDADALFANESSANLAITPEQNDLAYVIYTSGSTGRPKGVMVEHQSICNTAQALIREFDITPQSRVLQFTSFSFDVSVSEITMALLSGATLVLESRDRLLPGADFVRLLEEQAITTLSIPSSILGALDVHPLPALQTLIVGGDVCTSELVSRWGKGRNLFNCYGPTEATVTTTLFHCEDNVQNPPIGRPIAGSQVFLLDPNRQPVPIGVPGELYIGGAGVARGYLKQSELTEERFVPNPFADKPDARLYRTGDLARFRPDGNIEFLGRVDSQVKIRGFRIELGEIETALLQHPIIREAAVALREERSGSKRLVAYYVSEQEQVLGFAEIRSFLKETLPDYMVPSAFVNLKEFPLTPNGKLDHKALPAPELHSSDLNAASEAASSWTEQALIEIWSQVLSVPNVGKYDNFFALGGDSILSIFIVSKANQIGLGVTPKLLFQHQTIVELAAALEEGTSIEAEQGVVTGEVPLLPIQRWFFEQDFKTPQHWNQAMLLTFRRPVDPARIEQALAHLLVHHDALRLRFEKRDGVWLQRNEAVNEADPISFVVVDLSDVEEDKQGAQIETLGAQAQSSLNLQEGPLLRAVYFRMGSDISDSLLLVIHHLAVDGVSWRILLEHLQMAYEQLASGQSVRLPLKTTSYKRFSERLVEWANSDLLLEESSYWLSHAKREAYRLPTDKMAGANTEAEGDQVTVALLADETTALLREVPTAFQTQINDVLLTALVQTLSEWTGQRTHLIDLEGHGREDRLEDIDLSRTVGWFTSMYPILLELEGVTETEAALMSVKEQLSQVPRKGIGYGLLRYLCEEKEIRESLAKGPKASIGFNYLGQFDLVESEASLFGGIGDTAGPSFSLDATRPHLLDLGAIIRGGRLWMTWSYSRELYERKTIEGLAERYMTYLRAILAHGQSTDLERKAAPDLSKWGWDDEEMDDFLDELSDAFEE